MKKSGKTEISEQIPVWTEVTGRQRLDMNPEQALVSLSDHANMVNRYFVLEVFLSG